MNRPLGPETRPSALPAPEPADTAATAQPDAHDAYADVPGRTDPAAAPRDSELDGALRGVQRQWENEYAEHQAEPRGPHGEPIIGPGVGLRSHAAYADLPGARAAAPTQGDATPAPADLLVTIARGDGTVAWLLPLAPSVIADLDAETDDVAAAGYRLAAAYSIAENDPISGVYVITPPPASTCSTATAVLHAMAEVNVDRERDRAARWAGEAADIEHLLAEMSGIARDPDATGTEHARAALEEVHKIGCDAGKHATQQSVTGSVLAVAIARANGLPAEASSDAGIAYATRVREHLASERGWSA